jgi:diguanylate cyclase (GGDEF)-like protein/PAS domain S-box-containing protein
MVFAFSRDVRPGICGPLIVTDKNLNGVDAVADDKAEKYEKDFYKNILDKLYEGVYFCDRQRKITYWNSAAERITGYKKEEIIGSHCWANILTHTNARGENLCKSENCPAMRAMREQVLVEEEVFLKHKDGYRLPVVTRISPIKDDTGKITGAVEIFSDNSSRITAFQKIEKLEQLAFIDELTTVGNRRYSEIKIGGKLAEMSRYAWVEVFGLLFIDVDHFKDFNDNHGHNTGDRVLKMVAKTLISNIREEDFVGRWGGEEFVVVISGVDNKALFAAAEKLRSLVEHSVLTVEGNELNITVSVGATLAKRDDETEGLVKRADAFMYISKQNGRNTVTIG